MDIMLDLETLSSKPDAAIVAIGACTFNTNGERDTFYRVVDAESAERTGGRISASTVVWWSKQSDAARTVFSDKGCVDIGTALWDFRSWAGRFEAAVIWGNGAEFDNVVLRSAYERSGIAVPWSYRDNRCYRTLKNLRPAIAPVDYGTAHNALDDAVAQAMHAEKIFAALGLRQ